MMKVPLVDLRATYLPIREQLGDSFASVFEDMQLMLGPNTTAFEEKFARYCGVPYGLTCSSGTDAITLALLALDLPRGFEVIIPSHTFFATFESVVHAGGVPVMVDIDPDTYTLDPQRVEEAVTDKTAVIMPVHIYGHPADMDAIQAIADPRGLTVIEDAAQAHGARYKGRAAGGLGMAAGFSFYFTKNLGAFGEGGFVTTRDEKMFQRMTQLRHHGHVSKFEHVCVGYNMRMDELQAVVLLAKLPMLDANNRRRRAIAKHYDDGLAAFDLMIPKVADEAEPNFHCYVIQTPRRDELRHHLTESLIGTGVHYQTPIHLQPAVQTVQHRSHSMPITESVCRRCLTLPSYPEMTDEQTDYVISSIGRFFSH